jgi:tRNA-splicing endonuclease subunit Sen15, fungi type
MAPQQAQLPPLEPSAITKLIESASASENPLAATTIQILHNLQHQHLWTSLQIHDISTNPDIPESTVSDAPQTLISGIPPHRVYTHPDEQLYMLEKGIQEDDLRPERLFVIPTAQGQPWSLRRLAAAFDSLAVLEASMSESEGALSASETVEPEKTKKLDEYYERKEKAKLTKEWGTRRALLAMTNRGMGGEGTVVYYVVQEGEVKPRQN